MATDSADRSPAWEGNGNTFVTGTYIDDIREALSGERASCGEQKQPLVMVLNCAGTAQELTFSKESCPVDVPVEALLPMCQPLMRGPVPKHARWCSHGFTSV